MPDEYVTVEQALTATRSLALLVVRFCGIA